MSGKKSEFQEPSKEPNSKVKLKETKELIKSVSSCTPGSTKKPSSSTDEAYHNANSATGDSSKCIAPNCETDGGHSEREKVKWCEIHNKHALMDIELQSLLTAAVTLEDFLAKKDCDQSVDSAFEDSASVGWSSSEFSRQNSLMGASEVSSYSRRPSDLEDDFRSQTPVSRKSSRECRDELDSKEQSILEEEEESKLKSDPYNHLRTEEYPWKSEEFSKSYLGRRDSLLEAVLAAKKGGWNGLKRTDSLESSVSLSSFASSLASECPCDDCLLGLSDRLFQQPKPKKNSNWRKVRNVVQWTPFIQTYKRHKYPWVQLAGHQGNFKAGAKQGTIMKKLCPAEEKALNAIMKDVLKPYVPEYMGVEEGSDGEQYLSLQDLLSSFTAPCVMDVKMGVRTYLEEELAKARHKPKLRKDMYEKMVQIDPDAPTEAERLAKAVTKPRYMVWRETISSTSTLGFRIEGVRRGDGSSSKDFKTTKSRDQVTAAFKGFMKGHKHAGDKYIKKLHEIKGILENSEFFKSHELIGSSLLFVHSDVHADVWMIDFAKTCPLPGGVSISHKKPWVEGTHEDGYLIGLDQLITLIEESKDSGEEPIEVNVPTNDAKFPSQKDTLLETKLINAGDKVDPLNKSISNLNLGKTDKSSLKNDVILGETIKSEQKVIKSTTNLSNSTFNESDKNLIYNIEETASSGFSANKTEETQTKNSTTPTSLFKKR